jgi:signal transduction histidine kinase
MNITLVFFVYGLAFFSMGLALLFETGRSPLLAEARVLRPLAYFGLIHSLYEWLGMFMINNTGLVIRYPTLINRLRVGILMTSFVCLLIFGLRMLEPHSKFSIVEQRILLVGIPGYVLLIILVGIDLGMRTHNRVAYVDVLARYLLATPGAILAGLALYREGVFARRQGNPALGRALRLAAWGFILYACTQVFVGPLDLVAAAWMNAEKLLLFSGMPILVFRAIMAIFITAGLLRAIQLADVERQRQFLNAQQARLQALEQVEQELAKREALRQELTRRIVLREEEERALIARELHDETAQILTAFMFHLAALRATLHRQSKTRDQVDQLQNLSRQMSQRLHDLVHTLRPAQLDDLGLAPALKFLADESHQRLGLKVHFRLVGKPRRLDSLKETVLYRVAQESLTNVARHAGVRDADLSLTYQAESVHLSVLDCGAGFDLAARSQGWGLVGMRERAASVGSDLQIKTLPGQGTRVEIIVPLQPVALPAETLNSQEIQYAIPHTPDAR